LEALEAATNNQPARSDKLAAGKVGPTVGLRPLAAGPDGAAPQKFIDYNL
jgi:hypothetical protein